MIPSHAPHVNLVYGHWRYDDVFKEFRTHWNASTLAVASPSPQRTDSQLEWSWAMILRYRAMDAFAVRYHTLIAPEHQAAFEVILIADFDGDMLAAAYAYADAVRAARAVIDA